jgi:general stress protein 26
MNQESGRADPRDEAELRREALSRFAPETHVVLATAADGRPVQRRVTLLRAGARFYIATHSRSRKVSQLDRNDRYAVLLPLDAGQDHGYVELSGRVRPVHDRQEKVEVSEIAGFFTRFWRDVDDPDLTVYELRVESIHYLTPGSDEARELSMP